MLWLFAFVTLSFAAFEAWMLRAWERRYPELVWDSGLTFPDWVWGREGAMA